MSCDALAADVVNVVGCCFSRWCVGRWQRCRRSFIINKPWHAVQVFMLSREDYDPPEEPGDAAP